MAETEVILIGLPRRTCGKRFQVAGRALTLRYIVVQLREGKGKVLAQWMLLTNAPKRVTAEHLAHCYYWRWRIESYFKLLKSHGQQLEQWQQETGPAVARRLLVASMACVVVWQLQADDSQEAKELKRILIRLSGRQMKRNDPHTPRPSWPVSGSCCRCSVCWNITTSTNSGGSRTESRSSEN